ncbi:MAG: cold shock domain-containing protein [Gammaproteobacteria bacterium]|uniref:cold shock domain-containing protein n=1 Tax=Rhodoferax sp. TaxID=50421 RepID=UPI0018029DDD|nr:cold shock domain-containing protein [Rhodoferax sp.]MBU3899935.1 cold shock domain-containing protein [Gammaproteobacteria bacterium]MBA3057319.1 cold-shock protein [Rhodoferax sp.]MBU3996001.1 cold shock domain-containing protein [Gammaproteobacteria bacterium]MBU4019201.1 cold shock domain-containing protein [Gammaproteobacteria bacterium]MBU4078919.1 cold shock domain-containing protein [Gammaproteobacteria bacterium]
MRYDGSLKKWNAEGGFGFIAADDGGQELFAHISAFARDGQLPTVGERLSFEVEPDRDGKKRAVRVQRAGVVPAARAHTAKRSPRLSRSGHNQRKTGFGSKLIILAMLAALGGYGYSKYANYAMKIPSAPQSAFAPAAPATRAESAFATPAGFQCDGRKHCSQMTSCKEAKAFLKNCPGMEMDGNHDGVPCEQQWCTQPFAE